MCVNSRLPAKAQQRTRRAFGQLPRAHMLPERHEQCVRLNPLLAWQHVHEVIHRALWCRCMDDPPAIGHPMHVDVDADPRTLPATDPQRQVRTFRPDAAEAGQCVEIARQLAVKGAHRADCDLADLPRLGLVLNTSSTSNPRLRLRRRLFSKARVALSACCRIGGAPWRICFDLRVDRALARDGLRA